MSDPTYYDFLQRTHGYYLDDGVYNELIEYDYYAGDEIHTNNVIFKNTAYVTYDDTHIRFLNKSDIHLYDTSGIKIYDSGTFTMHTSASPDARAFVVDSIGRVGIGMVHSDPHSNTVEKPGFDLHVRGTVGIEDYMYHNDDTDTYMLFGSDQTTHYVNMTGGPDLDTTQDFDEINFRVGGVDMLQMLETDTGNSIKVNKNQSNVSTIIRSETNESAMIIQGDGTEVVINDTEQSDTNFRVKSSGTADIPEGHGPHEKSHAFFVDTETGRVGIGKSSPDTTLHVAGSAHIDGDLWVKGVTNQIDTLVHVTSAMDISNMGTGPALIVNQTGSQPVATFRDDGSDILYIEDLGNVGFQTGDPHTSVYINDHDGIRIPVGTTSQRPLSGAFGITGDVSTADFSDMYGTIRYNTQYQTFEGFGPGNAWGSLGGVIDIDRDTFWTALNDISGSDYPGDPDQLRAYVGNDNNPSTTNGTLMMTIDHNRTVVHKGKVGICTNTPEWPLDVVGDARLGDWYSKRTFRHNDSNYSATDYYLLLLEYDTTCYASGEIKGFRGGASEYNRNLDFTIHTNSTSFKSTGETEGRMVAVQGPGLNHHANGIGGFKSLTYGGKKYLALHIEAGTMYHAMDWDFQGRAFFQTSTNDYNFMRIVRDNQVADVADVNDHTTIDYNLYRLGKNVGIGTTEPQELLTIRGSGTSDYNAIRTSLGGANENLYFTEWKGASGFKVHRASGTSGNLTIGIDTPPDDDHVHFTDTGGHIAFKTNSSGTYAERVRIERDGNVGIGTTSPAEILHLKEDAPEIWLESSNVNGNTYAVKSTSTGQFWIGMPTSARTLSTSEARFAIDPAGNVGIGTTSPTSKLHVKSDSATPQSLGRFENPGGQALLQIKAKSNSLSIVEMADAEDGNVGAIQYDHSNNNMRFKTNDSEKVRILSNGNVGIGTTSPLTKLHLYENASTVLSNYTQAVSRAGVLIQSTYTNNTYTPGVFWSTSDNNATKPKAGVWTYMDGSGSRLYLGTSNSYNTGISNRAVTIDHRGYVGINDTTPSHALDVNGEIRSQTGWFRNHQDEKGLYNEENQNHFYSAAVDTWAMNTKTGSDNLYLQLKTDGYTGTTRGYLAGTHAGVGILDDDKNWAIQAITDNSVKLRVNNADVFTAGVSQVTGSYGTVQTHGSGKGNWEGYSINGRAVFMHNGGTETGIYNDVNNHWMLKAINAGTTGLYYNGAEKFRTTSDGAETLGTMYINDSSNRPGLVIKSNGSGDGWANQGCLIGLGESANKAGTGTAALYLTYNGNGNSWIGTGGVNSNGVPNKGYIQFSYSSNSLYFSANPSIAGSTNWHSGNDGSGSGLDADKLDGLQSGSFLRSDAADTFSGDLTSSGGARIILKKTDNNVSDHIQFFNGSTRVGEIGCEDTTWLRINQETAKNIYTPRMIRADGGFNVDNITVIDASGYIIGSRVSGTVPNADTVDSLHASSFARSDADDTITGLLTMSRSGECLRLRGSGASTSPYLSFYQYNPQSFSSVRRAYIQYNHSTYTLNLFNDVYDNHLAIGSDGSGLVWHYGGTGYTVWHKGNDGSGSTLDADLLDGLHASSFHRKGDNIDVGAAISANNVEGGEISIRTTTGLTPYYIDAYRDANNVYKHGAGKWLFRIFRETGALTFDSDTGTLRNMGDIVAYNSSDSKYKDNLTPIPDALNKTLSLTGYEFDWNDKQTTYTGHDVGVVAQEVEKVLPEIVETRADESKAVKYEKMIPLLIESIKEQQSQIDTLKTEIDRLKQQ